MDLECVENNRIKWKNSSIGDLFQVNIFFSFYSGFFHKFRSSKNILSKALTSHNYLNVIHAESIIIS